jgi:hypothetical protein
LAGFKVLPIFLRWNRGLSSVPVQVHWIPALTGSFYGTANYLYRVLVVLVQLEPTVEARCSNRHPQTT